MVHNSPPACVVSHMFQIHWETTSTTSSILPPPHLLPLPSHNPTTHPTTPFPQKNLPYPVKIKTAPNHVHVPLPGREINTPTQMRDPSLSRLSDNLTADYVLLVLRRHHSAISLPPSSHFPPVHNLGQCSTAGALYNNRDGRLDGSSRRPRRRLYVLPNSQLADTIV